MNRASILLAGSIAILLLPLAGVAGDKDPAATAVQSSRENQAPAAITTPDHATFDSHIAKLDELARSKDADATAWVRLGDALMQRSRESLSSDDYARSERAYQRALVLEPKNVQAMLGMAWVHNTEHAFDTGRRFAEAALEIDARLPEAHALLGDAAVELGDYDTAFEHYQESMDIRPDLSSYSRAGHLLWMTGDAVKAKWLMQKAITAGGSHAENTAWCRAQLALMSFHSGSLLPAEQQLDLALREAPRNPHVLAAAARIKTAQKDHEAALELYQKSIAAAPTHDALAGLVDAYELLGRRGEARAQFDRVVAFHHEHEGGHAHPHEHQLDGEPASPKPASTEVLEEAEAHGNYQLARFYADHDRELDEALREAKAAWRAYPNVIVADTLAWCLYKTGDTDEAAKMIRRALKHDTPDAAIQFHAGMIYAKLGNRPLAQQHLYRALSLNPHFHPTQVQLAAATIAQLSSQAKPTQEAE